MLRIAKTETGMVRGFPGTDARVTVFKGIPFADNTSGENYVTLIVNNSAGNVAYVGQYNADNVGKYAAKFN